MLGIVLSLIVAFLKSLGELFGKKHLSRNNNSHDLDEYSLALGVRSMVILPMFIVCFIVGLRYDIGEVFPALVASSLISAASTITMLKALKYSDLSIVGPLGALSIPFVILTGILFLGEVPSMLGILGVAFIFMGSYFLGIQKGNQNILSPIKNLAHDVGARYMLITSILLSITAALDKIGVESIGALHWLLYLNIGNTFFIWLYMRLSKKEIQFTKMYSLKNIKKISSIALVMGLGNVLQLIAIQYLLVSYVSAIKRSSGVFSVLLGAIFFKEKNIFWKLVASSIMILGVVCITLFGT